MKPVSRSGERAAVGATSPSDKAPDSAVLEMRPPIRADAFASGEVIGGKYVIDRVIGTGGVGVVLAAKHKELEEIVAIKFLRPEVQMKREIVERFAREAKAAVRIKSEYAARVYDVGVVAGRGPYLVMEYLEGKDLADVLGELGPLPVKRAVEYVMQACEALACAHAAGIIHRDIKPENLFLARRADGTELIKVLDFGISKTALTGSVFENEPEVTTQDLMGSPLYMSPEQIRSTGTVDHRSDIWSLGVVLYELVTGRVPFDGKSITEICAVVLEKEPAPLSTYMKEPPIGLQEVVDRCLQKDRAKRFQNVAELAIALLPFAPTVARVFAERASGILRAAGQPAPVAVRMQSSMPPPSARSGQIAPLPTPPSVPVLSLTPPPRSDAAKTDPEAFDAIAREARKTRRIVMGACLAVVCALGLAAAFFLRRPQPAPAASAPAPAAPVLRPVAIESDPVGARVEWQGKLAGETPLDLQLPPGVHTLHMTKDGYVAEDLAVTVAAGDTDTHLSRVVLKKVPPPPAPSSSALANPWGRPALTPSARPHPKPQPLATTSGLAVAPSVPPVPPPAATTAAPTSATTAAPPRVKLLDDNNRVRILDEK
jgi:serine/threonine-protein kinase